MQCIDLYMYFVYYIVYSYKQILHPYVKNQIEMDVDIMRAAAAVIELLPRMCKSLLMLYCIYITARNYCPYWAHCHEHMCALHNWVDAATSWCNVHACHCATNCAYIREMTSSTRSNIAVSVITCVASQSLCTYIYILVFLMICCMTWHLHDIFFKTAWLSLRESVEEFARLMGGQVNFNYLHFDTPIIVLLFSLVQGVHIVLYISF